MSAAPFIGTQVPEHTGRASIQQALATVIALLEAHEGCARRESPDGTSEELLLDTELGGVRYLLLRMCGHEQSRIHLSPRELEIVRMVAKGHPNKVIADVLNISSWTVCTHLRRIFAKLGVGSRAAMVAQLLEMGALTADSRVPTNIKSNRAAP